MFSKFKKNEIVINESINKEDNLSKKSSKKALNQDNFDDIENKKNINSEDNEQLNYKNSEKNSQKMEGGDDFDENLEQNSPKIEENDKTEEEKNNENTKEDNNKEEENGKSKKYADFRNKKERLNNRLKKNKGNNNTPQLQVQNQPKIEGEKFGPIRKSAFIGDMVKLLEQQMNKNNDEENEGNQNEDENNLNVFEKEGENLKENTEICNLIDSKPVVKNKKKKSKVTFEE